MMTYLSLMASGFLGGLILNVMPCVLPVLFLKASKWMASAHADASDQRRDAFGYLLGTWVIFGAFAILVQVMKASGESFGWGMHMQNPWFVSFIITLLFVFGLNAFGFFEIHVSMQSSTEQREGLTASILNGMFITLVATPCSAPFLGSAISAALATDASFAQSLSLFLSIGLGLASPVILLSFMPRAAKLIPKPGAWMEHFKHVVGFTMIGASVWFFETLQRQSLKTSGQLLWLLTALSFLIWLRSTLQLKLKSWRVTHELMMACLLGLFGWLIFSSGGEETRWVKYDESLKAEALAKGQPVFVDFTADWCASCKTFEKTYLNTDEYQRAFEETGVMTMKADLTKNNPELWAELKRVKRRALPVYIIYRPDGSLDVLPEGAPTTLIERLRAASRGETTGEGASGATAQTGEPQIKEPQAKEPQAKEPKSPQEDLKLAPGESRVSVFREEYESPRNYVVTFKRTGDMCALKVRARNGFKINPDPNFVVKVKLEEGAALFKTSELGQAQMKRSKYELLFEVGCTAPKVNTALSARADVSVCKDGFGCEVLLQELWSWETSALN